MVKSIKWELRKQIYRSRGILVTMLAVFLILLILPGSLMQSYPNAMSTIILILTLALVWGLVCLLIYSVSNLTSDFAKPTYRLERSTGRSYMMMFLIKIGFNVVYVLMSTLVVIIGRELISKFNTEHRKFFLVQLNRPYYVFMLEVSILYPITILFVFLLTKRFSQSKYTQIIFIILAVGILYEIASYWRENKIVYIVALVILSSSMLYGASWISEKRALKS